LTLHFHFDLLLLLVLVFSVGVTHETESSVMNDAHSHAVTVL